MALSRDADEADPDEPLEGSVLVNFREEPEDTEIVVEEGAAEVDVDTDEDELERGFEEDEEEGVEEEKRSESSKSWEIGSAEGAGVGAD